MKTIRNLTILAGLSVVLFTLGTTGARAQMLTSTSFSGDFTLPVAAQWGNMTLPAGTYSFRYGTLNNAYFVEVRGTVKGSSHGVIHVAANDQLSAAKSELVCVREGNGLIVRRLEIPQLGKSVTFAMPYGAKLAAQNRKQTGYTQLAEAPMLVERIPVTLNAK